MPKNLNKKPHHFKIMDILRKKSPLNKNKIRKELGKIAESSLNWALEQGIYYELFQQLKDNRYADYYYIDLEEEIKEIIEEYPSLGPPHITKEEIAYKLGKDPNDQDFLKAFAKVIEDDDLRVKITNL